MKTKKTTKKEPTGTKVSKEFEFTLTDSEKSAIADKGAALHMNVEVTKQSFKELKTEWGARIRTLEAQHAETQHAISSGKENRVVDVVLVKDFNSKEIQYWFETDGEWNKIESRTMTVEETQMEMGDVKGIARAAKQKIKKDEPKTADEEIGDVIKEETSRKTKRSAVDGAIQQ